MGLQVPPPDVTLSLRRVQLNPPQDPQNLATFLKDHPKAIRGKDVDYHGG